MKTTMRITILLSTLFTSSVFANQSYLTPGAHQTIGLEGYHYRYSETYMSKFYMDLKGPVLGLYYDFAFQPENSCFRFGLEGRATRGFNIHYHSSDLSYGNRNGDTTVLFEGRVLGSYVLSFENQWALESYLGLGLRFLNHSSRKISTTGRGPGYSRKSRYNYVPIGLRVIKELPCEMKWIGYVEYDWFLYGLQTGYLTSGNVRTPQHHGCGFRLGADLRIPSSTYCLDYTIGVFARFWNINDSKKAADATGQLWMEPKNKTTEIGVRLGIAF